MVRVGTSGFSYSSWRGRFYPEEIPRSRWLEYYSQVFDAVEINSTFYRLPKPATLKRWAGLSLTGDFKFVLKAYRGITHLFPSDGTKDEFMKRATDMLKLFSTLGERLGGVLWQFPPSAKPDTHMWRIELVGLVSSRFDVPAFVEVRSKAWWDVQFDGLGVVPVAYHMVAKSKLMHTPEWFLAGQLVYVRFHGYGRRYGGCYPDEFLRQWADLLRGKEGYAFFNNDADGFAPENALSLKSMLSK